MTRRPFWPWFFLVATLVSFFWPGWAAESADFARVAFNALAGREALTAWQPIALAMMVSIWAALALSRIVYNALETFEIALVLTLFPLLFLALFAAGVLLGTWSCSRRARIDRVGAPAAPVGRPVPHAPDRGRLRGVRGTLLLAQSLWVRDKGFAMSAFQGGSRAFGEERASRGARLRLFRRPPGLRRALPRLDGPRRRSCSGRSPCSSC